MDINIFVGSCVQQKGLLNIIPILTHSVIVQNTCTAVWKRLDILRNYSFHKHINFFLQNENLQLRQLLLKLTI